MSDSSGIGDGVTVAVNDDVVQGGDVHAPDAKGPDPDAWGNGPRAERNDEATAAYEAAAGDAVKGPGPEWDDDARAERGAVYDPQPDEDDEPS